MQHNFTKKKAAAYLGFAGQIDSNHKTSYVLMVVASLFFTPNVFADTIINQEPMLAVVENTSTPLPYDSSIGNNRDSNAILDNTLLNRQNIEVTSIQTNTAPTTLTPETSDSNTNTAKQNEKPKNSIEGIVKINGIVLEEAAEVEENTGYVDILIDPNIAPDTIDQFLIDNESNAFNLYQNFDFRSETRVDVNDERNTIAGLEYTAIKETANFGSFKLLATYSEGSESFTFNSNENDLDGLRYYQLEQSNLPLTETLYMNNTIGTHRVNNNRRYSRNLISRRFNSNAPDILGITSQFFTDNTTFTLNLGELGSGSGSVVRGFEKDDGSLQRAEINHSINNHLVSAEIWNTSNFDDNQDINEDENFVDAPNRGYRLTLDSLHSAFWKTSISAAASEDAFALLAGAEYDQQYFSQDFGAYYYEPNFAWLNRSVDQDSLGAYYRFSNKNYLFNYGLNSEFRRQGISSDESSARDTYFFSLPVGYRIDRNKRINFTPRLRYLDDRNTENSDNSYLEVGFRTGLSIVHSSENRSNLSFNYSQRNGESDENSDMRYSVDYSYNHNLSSSSSADFGLGYTRNDEDDGLTSNDYSIDAGWQKDFSHGQSIYTRAGYTISDDSRGRDDDRFNAGVGASWPVTDRLFFNARADYNRNIFDQDEINNQNELFTEDDDFFNQDNLSDTDDYSIFLNIQYTLDGRKGDNILSQRIGSAGSGSISGYVYVDENLDGIRQSNEPGLAGVDVYLNSIYPTRTNSDGRYQFQRVGTGEHVIYIDETELPLPWILQGGAFKPITVNLRSNQKLDIALTTPDDEFLLPE